MYDAPQAPDSPKPFTKTREKILEIRETHVFVREVLNHAGRKVDPPALCVVACAVLVNPGAGRPMEANLDDYIAASHEVGELLAKKALDAMGGRKPTAFGKGVMVGADGDLEQGASMIHCRIGLAIRTAVKAGLAMIPGNAKLGSPGATLDVVLGGIDNGWDYDAMDTIEVRVPGAPRADEILLAVAYATGRPNARITGASEQVVHDLVAKLKAR
ncbi:MAG TPA: amino acid synthesis family protein [Burkholderiales bacterium]|nr:amino acid synthesis family protein [Burkholderiales bacterium]